MDKDKLEILKRLLSLAESCFCSIDPSTKLIIADNPYGTKDHDAIPSVPEDPMIKAIASAGMKPVYTKPDIEKENAKKEKQRAYARAHYYKMKEKKEAVGRIVLKSRKKKEEATAPVVPVDPPKEARYHCFSCGAHFFSSTRFMDVTCNECSSINIEKADQ